MCYTDIAVSAGKTSKIACASMDGSDNKDVITEDLSSPNGIVIDYRSKLLL